MVVTKPFQRLTVEGTRQALIVRFVNAKIFAADEIQEIGREMLRAADLAHSIDMPLVLCFQGVEDVSSGLIGKLALLRKKTKSHGIKLSFADISPALLQKFRPDDEGLHAG